MSAQETVNPQEITAHEATQRPKVALAAGLGGILTVLSGVYLQLAVYANRPDVDVLDTLGPLITSGSSAKQSAQLPLLRYLDDHSFQLMLAALTSGVGTLCIGFALFFLFRSAYNRGAQAPSFARYLVLVGPLAVALVSISVQILFSLKISTFLDGSDKTPAAVSNISQAGDIRALGIVGVFGQVALGFAFGLTAYYAMKVGLLTRFMGVLGVIVGVLFAVPVLGSSIPIVQTFWLVAFAVLLSGRWPGGDLSAWKDGVARPWPTRQELLETKQKQS